TGHHDRSLHRRWREERTSSILLQLREGGRFQLRREIDDVVFSETLLGKRSGFGGKRLSRRAFFSRYIALWYRSLLDRPDRLAGHAIENVEKSCLAGRSDNIGGFPVNMHGSERWRRGEVIIPQSVVHRLEMPHALTRVGIKADECLS